MSWALRSQLEEVGSPPLQYLTGQRAKSAVDCVTPSVKVLGCACMINLERRTQSNIIKSQHDDGRNIPTCRESEL